MRIAPASAADAADWTAMRGALWPSGAGGDHAREIAELLGEPGETLNLLARDEDNQALGFLEVSIRHDYVNGCKTSPVAFLEGIFVWPAARGRGVARAMVAEAEDWARQQGLREFASDAPVQNDGSQAMHAALGFEETQRVVFFRKRLA
ncbi:aminoglycoside 6'-N-acetyltransferase [Devosia ureilytica]|uniref:aminoglycoside 6'-N-acetyltransferase n=1 Tax=Devosia ureilytica TaxID=2952754 RepID=UPI0020C82258